MYRLLFCRQLEIDFDGEINSLLLMILLSYNPKNDKKGKNNNYKNEMSQLINSHASTFQSLTFYVTQKVCQRKLIVFLAVQMQRKRFGVNRKVTITD